MDGFNVCAKSMVTRLIPHYRADLPGAPFEVIIIGAVVEDYCSECGASVKTTIPDLEGLLHAVAAARCAVPRKLSGAEIKFLRRAMGWKAKDVAGKLDMTPENFSRVENNAKLLGPQSEKLFRILVTVGSVGKGGLETGVAEAVAKLVELKIETFWNPDERLAMRFVRVRKQPAGCGGNDGGRWVARGTQGAA